MQLNGSRKVIGLLRGYDVCFSRLNLSIKQKKNKNLNSNMRKISQVFLNIVLDDAVEEKAGGEKVRVGMVVSRLYEFKWTQS